MARRKHRLDRLIQRNMQEEHPISVRNGEDFYCVVKVFPHTRKLAMIICESVPFTHIDKLAVLLPIVSVIVLEINTNGGIGIRHAALSENPGS